MNNDDVKNIVTLRDVTEDDLPIFFEQQQDIGANQLAGVPARDRDDFWAHWRKNMGNESSLIKAVLFNDQLAGNILSWRQDGERKLGYWLGRDYWGKGIASQAVAQFLTLETERPLYAYVTKQNRASMRILEKQEFKIVGELNEPSRPGDEMGTLYIMRLYS